jgi:hypothetical protein
MYHYNSTIGSACSQDSDCITTCFSALNKNYIKIPVYYQTLIGCVQGYAICEENICKKITYYTATSVEQCNKMEHEFHQMACLTNVAKKLNDSTICNEIADPVQRELCIRDIN